MRVLLVEDESELIEVMTAMLRGLGCQARPCASAEEALDILARDPAAIDLVLTDYCLPGMSGVQMAQRVHERFGPLPVVLCTGYWFPETLDQADESGIQDVLHKPFGLRDLARLVDRFRPEAMPPSSRPPVADSRQPHRREA